MPIGELYSENNYSAFTGDNFNITLFNIKTKIGRNTDASFGIGNVWTYEDKQNKNVPAMEAMLTQNVGEYLNGYTRFRKFGNNEEYRVAFGANYGIDNHHSIYAGTHYTMNNDGEWSRNTGYWLGYSYQFNNGASISAEFEQGVPLNKTAPSIGHTLGSFNDANKTFNLTVAIPIK